MIGVSTYAASSKFLAAKALLPSAFRASAIVRVCQAVRSRRSCSKFVKLEGLKKEADCLVPGIYAGSPQRQLSRTFEALRTDQAYGAHLETRCTCLGPHFVRCLQNFGRIQIQYLCSVLRSIIHAHHSLSKAHRNVSVTATHLISWSTNMTIYSYPDR
jgi:hypothetical protein